MKKKEVLKRLKNDEDYYGEFGKKYLSNSDISTLLTNPLLLGQRQPMISAFLIGGYFHTAILEPEKLGKYKITDATSRNTKAFRELEDLDVYLLQKEVDQIDLMTGKMLNNDICKDLIRSIGNEYEVPGIKEIHGEMWKGKADIVNHNQKLVVDLKTSGDISKFRYSAKKYNYDSQAYIYSQLFGYEMIFIVIDKNTLQLGIFDCSDAFLRSGEDKVLKAIDAYRLFFKSKDFDPEQYFLNQTL